MLSTRLGYLLAFASVPDPTISNLLGMEHCNVFDRVPNSLSMSHGIVNDPKATYIKELQENQLIATVISPWL